MPLKLYANPGSYTTQKALVIANYVGLELETPAGATTQVGKIPVLETEQGCIFSSMAIARYLARMNRQVGLYGQNLMEGGLIDSWLEFATHEFEVPLNAWLRQISTETTNVAQEDVKRALTILNNHLLHHTFMVGHTFTLADISIICALAEGKRHVISDEFLRPFGNVLRWFNLCIGQPEFAVLKSNSKVSAPATSSKAEAKGKPEGSKAEDKKEDKKEAAPKKEKDSKKEEVKKEDGKKGDAKEPAAKKEAQPKKEAKKGKDEKKDAAAEEKPAADPEKARKDKLKKVVKEGGKRGVEIEGAADMGGLQFFCTSVDEPEGDLELLVESMKAMNAKSDPTDEERKGGSGHIGKMIFSAGLEQLAVVAYVPTDKHGELSCEEWLKSVLALFNGEVLSAAADVCAGRVKANPDKSVFPLKIREPMILEANNFLRKKGLFPEDDGDDDEMVFGDDDFPS